MTSRDSFYKCMITDLRHRVWMIALSCLGSFLAMPIYMLLMKQQWENRILNYVFDADRTLEAFKFESVYSYFAEYLTVTGGIIAIAGALIVGIFGFRYVYSKKMVDLYHSVPITRRELFLVHYINGFIIWLVPMLLGAVACALIALPFIGDAAVWTGLVLELLKTVGFLVISFLLTYHLAILAVMISGNVLNTLVSGTIMGCGALAVYALCVVFCESYFDTYYSFFEDNMVRMIWMSPFASAIYNLVMRVGTIQMVTLVMNLVMIVLLLGLAFFAYMRRPSELAEQGIKIEWVQVLFKTVLTILAGMCGWIILNMLVATEGVVWPIFGAVLCAVLCYGILDIIFHMDFKAFFAHKLQMAATVAISLIVGFTFMFDLVGYDSYVPSKDKIAEMGIVISGYTLTPNEYVYDGQLSTKYRVDHMQYTDQEGIYNFLEAVTGKETKYPLNGRSTQATVRVTQTNGRTYYRSYLVWESDEDVIVPILRDESYIRANILIPDVVLDDVEKTLLDGRVRLESFLSKKEFNGIDPAEPEIIREILQAYNADMLANPDIFIYQEDEVLCQVEYRGYDGARYHYMYPDIYESMGRTVAVLDKYGYSDNLKLPAADCFDEISITAYAGGYGDFKTLEQVLGLDEDSKYAPDIPVDLLNGNSLGSPIVMEGMEAAVEIYPATTQEIGLNDTYYHATFTNPADIAELLKVISFSTPYHHAIFGAEYANVDVHVSMLDGNNYYVSLKNGILPEKFLAAFELVDGEEAYSK